MTHTIKTKIAENGQLFLQGLPFVKGEQVEIIIKSLEPENLEEQIKPLKGKVISYENPFEPAVNQEDWDVLQ
jgi:hypothetical protein